MRRYDSWCDDFYVNMNVATEMDLPQTREAVLHFFEQIQKKYPSLRNFYNRERVEYVLEEEKDRRAHRWVTLEARRVSAGTLNPDSYDEALRQHRWVLEVAPYALSLSALDCESVNVMCGFDFNYRGNHGEVLAEALGLLPAFERLGDIEHAQLLSNEPALQFSLDPECRTQCRLSFETRTSAYHVRTREFPEEQLSVYVMLRRYGSLEPGETFVSVFDQLAAKCAGIVDDYVIESILKPLKQTIAIK